MVTINALDAGTEIQQKIIVALDNALSQALEMFDSGSAPKNKLSDRLTTSLSVLSEKSKKASTGFTNIVTCLAIKTALPNVDIRYHQVQIQNLTDRPAGFNFRGVSEKIVYPWLSSKSFEGAKSGWQTRTFERPKPYMETYDENIGDIKDAFLAVFDEIEEHGESAERALAYLAYRQLQLREKNKIMLSVPKTQDIQLIVDVFCKHFFHKYHASKGASRLPVLAIYAIYSVMIEQLKRFNGMSLKPLEAHSAADKQTGAVGDIEVIFDDTKEVFEAIEVKHNIPLSAGIIGEAGKKIQSKSVNRYYVLTTSSNCDPDEASMALISKIQALYNCQLIANGVVPTIKYYLRLLSDPSAVFPKYVALLQSDNAIAHEHREFWNVLVTQSA